MIESQSTQQQLEQARLELSMAAGSSARANRPRGLIIIAGLLVVVAIAALIWSFWARGAAQLSLASAKRALADATASRNELMALNQEVEAKGLAPDPRMAQRLESLAQAAGLRITAPISDNLEAPNIPGIRRRTYTVNLGVIDNPRALFGWLASVQAAPETRSVELIYLKLVPASQQNPAGGPGTFGPDGKPLQPSATPTTTPQTAWNTEVKFARSERAEATR